MPENDNTETLYSFENIPYVPIEDTAGSVVFLEANSLFIMPGYHFSDYTAYSDGALPVGSRERVEIDGVNSRIDSPWRTTGHGSAHDLGEEREFGWHFNVDNGPDCNTSDILINNIEEFIVESEEDIPDRNERSGLFTDNRFYPEPVTEDELSIENGEVIVTDNAVLEFDPEDAILVPCQRNPNCMKILCKESITLLGSFPRSSVMHACSDVDIGQYDGIQQNDYVVEIPLSVDIPFSEYMISLTDDVKLTGIETNDAVVFDVERVRGNRLATERSTGTVMEVLGRGDFAKGYTVSTEDGNVVDIPATAVVWAESRINDIPEWAR